MLSSHWSNTKSSKQWLVSFFSFKTFDNKTINHLNLELKVFAPIATELISFWPEVPKEKLVEGLFATLVNWVNQHSESILLLLFMHVAIVSLGKTSPQIGLTLLDSCVAAYFKREFNLLA
jgi:hypothetical protein